MTTPLSQDVIRQSIPRDGLFTKEWYLSSRPLVLDKSLSSELRSLGHILGKFYDACNDLYHASAKGDRVPWVAELLDTGKPAHLLQLQQSAPLRYASPQVIRPDLMLTDKGFALTELDSVPGGIGITHWLSQLYASHGWDVVGGADGMREGFRSILPRGADILVSKESADYWQEMNYLAGILGADFHAHQAEEYQPSGNSDHRPVYRFFELFDLPQIQGAMQLLETLSPTNSITPPAKPHLEEKLWLALFHSPGLQSEWKKRLRGSHHERLLKLIPHSWVLDPTPLPPQAALPWLNLNSWEDVSRFSQKQRRLVIKISGFHEKAWGARGVYIGHDIPSDEWRQVLQTALSDYTTSPWLMQEFLSSVPVEHPYYDPKTGEERLRQGFARITPYYFRPTEGDITLGGCLATIVPKDKKKIHGMSDAILVPCVLTQ